MTYQEAIRILYPDTTLEALAEYEYYGGFNGKSTKIKAVEEACVVACEAMGRNVAQKVDLSPTSDYDDHKRRWICPNCGNVITGNPIDEDEYAENHSFCFFCGQALDWSDVK